MTRYRQIFCASMALSTASLVGQKMPDPRDNSRVVQLHDALPWVEFASPGKQISADGLSNEDRGLLAAARFAKAFCVPAMAAEEDVSVLAHRYLVAVGRPRQQAWITAWLKALESASMDRIELRVAQFGMSEGYFDRVLAPLLAKPMTRIDASNGELPRQWADLPVGNVAAVLDGLSEKEDVIVGPEMVESVRPLNLIERSRGRTIPYRRDYDVEIGGKHEPVVIYDTVFDGVAVNGACARLDEGGFGVTLRVTSTDVVEPIPTFEANHLGEKMVIDLPSSTAITSEWNLLVGKSGYALCVVQTGKSCIAYLVYAGDSPVPVVPPLNLK